MELKSVKICRVRTAFGSCDVEKAHGFVGRSTFGSKSGKTHYSPTTCGHRDVEKVQALLARSTFRSKNLEKHVNIGVFLDIAMSKKYYMPLGREAHFEVHSGHHTFEPFLDITISKKMHCVVPQSTFKRKK